MQTLSELQTTPCKLDNAQRIAKILGSDAAQRLKLLAEAQPGWDGTDAKPMGEQSLSAARQFFEKISVPAANTGLFLSYDGELIASWPMTRGTVDVTFENNRVHLRCEHFERTLCIKDSGLQAALDSAFNGGQYAAGH